MQIKYLARHHNGEFACGDPELPFKMRWPNRILQIVL